MKNTKLLLKILMKIIAQQAYLFFHTWTWMLIHFALVVIISLIDKADSITSTAAIAGMSWAAWTLKIFLFPIKPTKRK